MVLLIESVILCLLFTGMVYLMSRDPIKTLYNYPPAIQERVKSLPAYQDRIPTERKKVGAKLIASAGFVIVLALILRYVNGYTTFWKAFGYGFLLWTVVNLWDLVVLDILWFCHDPHFVIKGTEDMTRDYHDYWFHVKGALIGMVLAVPAAMIAGLIVIL